MPSDWILSLGIFICIIPFFTRLAFKRHQPLNKHKPDASATHPNYALQQHFKQLESEAMLKKASYQAKYPPAKRSRSRREPDAPLR